MDQVILSILAPLFGISIVLLNEYGLLNLRTLLIYFASVISVSIIINLAFYINQTPSAESAFGTGDINKDVNWAHIHTQLTANSIWLGNWLLGSMFFISSYLVASTFAGIKKLRQRN